MPYKSTEARHAYQRSYRGTAKGKEVKARSRQKQREKRPVDVVPSITPGPLLAALNAWR